MQRLYRLSAWRTHISWWQRQRSSACLRCRQQTLLWHDQGTGQKGQIAKWQKETGKKVPFLTRIKWNTERRRSGCDWLCPSWLQFSTRIKNCCFLKDDAAQPIQPRSHSNLRTKCHFFADLSVSKTYFTDKPAFPGDLSVNFWPLCWGFTDKSRFLDHLSVKTGPKRLNFYGRTAIFDHFVRNRYFSGRPFTDRVPIFIDVSVNGRSFAKCSAR